MRMRRKPNLDKRLAECEKQIIRSPEELRGSWKGGYRQLKIELGCGKGSFTLKTAQSEPEDLMVAVEREESALVMAAEKARDAGAENIRFVDGDVKNLPLYFAEGEADVIYVNFCDPWPKSRDAKFRLTAPNYLRMYATILKDGGELRFRTDNRPLFDWSLDGIRSEGWELTLVENDAQNEIRTDYEAKFSAQGIKINMLTAVKTASTKTVKDGEVPRLRNAALSDARCFQ